MYRKLNTLTFLVHYYPRNKNENKKDRSPCVIFSNYGSDQNSIWYNEVLSAVLSVRHKWKHLPKNRIFDSVVVIRIFTTTYILFMLAWV